MSKREQSCKFCKLICLLLFQILMLKEMYSGELSNVEAMNKTAMELTLFYQFRRYWIKENAPDSVVKAVRFIFCLCGFVCFLTKLFCFQFLKNNPALAQQDVSGWSESIIKRYIEVKCIYFVCFLILCLLFFISDCPQPKSSHSNHTSVTVFQSPEGNHSLS